MVIVSDVIEAAAPAGPSIRLRVIDFPDQAFALRAAWNALAVRSETGTIFQTFEWHLSWWQAFGDAVRPLVIIAESGADSDAMLVGVAPLMLARRRILATHRRLIEFIGTGPTDTRASDYADFLIDRAHPEVLAAFARWLIDHRGDWDLLRLTNVPGTSRTLSLAEEFRAHRCAVDLRIAHEAPTRVFGHGADDAALLKKKSLKRHFSAFEKRGRLAFVARVAPDDVPAMLDLLFEHHIRRWQRTDKASQFLDARQKRLYRCLASNLAPTGWLLFSAVLFNDDVIALHFGFEYGGRLIWYKPTFNVGYAKHSPGEVLIKYLFEYAIARGLQEFDFTIGEESFKYRFANLVRTTHQVHVCRHRRDHHVLRLWLDLRAFIVRHPRLATGARRLRTWWQAMRR